MILKLMNCYSYHDVWLQGGCGGPDIEEEEETQQKPYVV